MTIQEFLNTNPSKEEVAKMLCHMANCIVFNPPWTVRGWDELSKYADLSEDDFWEDADDLTPMDYINGQTAWKYKVTGEEFTDNDKFDKLANQGRLIHEEMQRALDTANKKRLTF